MDKCQVIESRYQKEIRIASPVFLQDAMPFLEMLETNNNFCDEVFSDGDDFTKLTVTPENCKSFENGITSLGLTNIYQTTY